MHVIIIARVHFWPTAEDLRLMRPGEAACAYALSSSWASFLMLSLQLCYLHDGGTAQSGVLMPMSPAAMQVVMPQAPQWQEEHALWRRADDLRLGLAKEYQSQVRASGRHEGAKEHQSQVYFGQQQTSDWPRADVSGRCPEFSMGVLCSSAPIYGRRGHGVEATELS